MKAGNEHEAAFLDIGWRRVRRNSGLVRDPEFRQGLCCSARLLDGTVVSAASGDHRRHRIGLRLSYPAEAKLL